MIIYFPGLAQALQKTSRWFKLAVCAHTSSFSEMMRLYKCCHM